MPISEACVGVVGEASTCDCCDSVSDALYQIVTNPLLLQCVID